MLIRRLSDENLSMQDVPLESLANTVIDAMLHRQSDPDVQVEVTCVYTCLPACLYCSFPSSCYSKFLVCTCTFYCKLCAML